MLLETADLMLLQAVGVMLFPAANLIALIIGGLVFTALTDSWLYALT